MKDFIVVYQGPSTMKVAYRNAEELAIGLMANTAAGWSAQHVYQRDRKQHEAPSIKADLSDRYENDVRRVPADR
jgi:hypothetical protein